MNIAYKIMSGKDVTVDELKYLLWVTLCDRQSHTSEEIIGIDEDEVFNVDDLLDQLDVALGMLPGGKL